MGYKQSLAIAVLVLKLLQPSPSAWAQASDPFIGQLMMGAWNFCPTGWLKADGQILPIAQNTALFSLLGTMYGGDRRTTFALPDLRGRVPVQWGNGPGGLVTQQTGERGGEVMHALTADEMPPHQHSLNASNGRTESFAEGNMLSARAELRFVRPERGKPIPLHPMSIGPAGAGAPHNVMPPYLTITVCIAAQGVFPPRN